MQTGAELPIGLFDSGLGGLTVWQEVRRQLPQERVIYLGDTARVPYGERSATEITRFVQEITAWMLTHPVKLIAMACNTSSALALEQVQAQCPVPLLGIIRPGAQAAAKQGSRIGVLATTGTVQSQAYPRALSELGAICWQVPCPSFVPLIEAGHRDSLQVRQVAQEYLQPLLAAQIDTLVYGCTHYPLLDPLFRQLLPPQVRRVDPAVAVVQAIKRELDLWGLRRRRGLGQTQFFVTGDPEAFAIRAQGWLGFHPPVQAVDVAVAARQVP
ncbi:MAG: glutamate racemase [Synechococcales cyanobacterium]